MIDESIKKIVYNNIREKLIVVLKNDDIKTLDMSQEEYEEVLKSGKFKEFIDNHV